MRILCFLFSFLLPLPLSVSDLCVHGSACHGPRGRQQQSAPTVAKEEDNPSLNQDKVQRHLAATAWTSSSSSSSPSSRCTPPLCYEPRKRNLFFLLSFSFSLFVFPSFLKNLNLARRADLALQILLEQKTRWPPISLSTTTLTSP